MVTTNNEISVVGRHFLDDFAVTRRDRHRDLLPAWYLRPARAAPLAAEVHAFLEQSAVRAQHSQCLRLIPESHFLYDVRRITGRELALHDRDRHRQMIGQLVDGSEIPVLVKEFTHLGVRTPFRFPEYARPLARGVIFSAVPFADVLAVN
jgi:hypothetical protein